MPDLFASVVNIQPSISKDRAPTVDRLPGMPPRMTSGIYGTPQVVPSTYEPPTP